MKLCCLQYLNYIFFYYLDLTNFIIDLDEVVLS
jgi:hypothetical protein